MLTARTVLCFVLVCASTKLCLAQNATADEVEIQMPLGKLKGSHMTSRLGQKIYAFRGVRYAEAPIGLQRFQPPIPVKPWDVFDASEDGPQCPQNTVDELMLQSEDCLRLNVYTTKLSTASEIVKRPVIVFFSGFEFILSTTLSNDHGPEYLLDQNVVLVTVNYRLSALGFMSTGDSLLPGNLGLKDQVEALRWVKKNIAAFGGDPNCVTISGHDSGSWSVSLHLVSPMSKGLFHRAIASGGSATIHEPLPTNQTNLTKKQAEILSCPTDTVGNMLVCLNTKTAEDFTQSLFQLYDTFDNSNALWLPVVEPEVRGVERFLPAQPIDLIKQGKFHKVPFITGITKDKINNNIATILKSLNGQDGAKNEDVNSESRMLKSFNYFFGNNMECMESINERVKEYYLNNKSIGTNNTEGIVHLYTDSSMGYPVHRLVNLVAEASEEPVYYYEFAYQGPDSQVTLHDTEVTFADGRSRRADVLYVFRAKSHPEFETHPSNIKTIERMTGIWANFAETGEPIPKQDKDNVFANVAWEKFTTTNKKYLEIDEKLTVKTNLNGDRMKIWDELFLQKCT